MNVRIAHRGVGGVRRRAEALFSSFSSLAAEGAGDVASWRAGGMDQVGR